ncbi:MAG TPA: hypothetical protein VNT03_12240 [Baekduia sp.]|nr:hypothetical protein [Baekduia sp.]
MAARAVDLLTPVGDAPEDLAQPLRAVDAALRRAVVDQGSPLRVDRRARRSARATPAAARWRPHPSVRLARPGSRRRRAPAGFAFGTVGSGYDAGGNGSANDWTASGGMDGGGDGCSGFDGGGC